MPRMQNTEIDYLHQQPATAMWTGPSGTVHTVTGRLYEHVGRLYLAGRRVSWLIEAGATVHHPDAAWLAGLLERSLGQPVAA
ncbi:MAG: hypothetical protein V9G19_03830 [Tetrasphaera sp.]